MIRLICFWAVVVASVLAAPTASAQSLTFTNPIAASGADPWIVYHDGWYYFTATESTRIDIRKAKSLATLTSAKPVTIWRAPETGPYSRAIWAPEFHRIKDKWYVYFTGTTEDNSDTNRRIYALESKTGDLQGEFTFKGKVAVPDNDEYAIDGTLFQQGEKFYFLWSGREKSAAGAQNIYIAPMSNPWTINGPRVQLSTPEHAWEKHGWLVNEGPEVLQNNGKTFVVYSGSGFTTPNYSLGLLEHLGGDLLDAKQWKKHPQPVFTQYEGADGKVYGPGHNGFFKSPNGKEDWIVYHARNTSQTVAHGRTARAQKFTWNADGTPNFGHPIPPGIALPLPAE